MTTLVRILTSLFFFVFPLGLLIRFKVADNVFVSLLELIIALLFCLLLFNPKLLVQRLLENNFIKFQILFVSVGFISLVINYFIYKDINLFPSLLYLIRYIMVISLILVGQIYFNIIKIKNLVMYSGVGFILFGFFQYLFVYDLRPYTYLGWDDHLYRLVSTFIDPNFSGLFYSMFLLLLLFTAFKKTFKEEIFELIVLFLSGVAVFATYSRSALLSLIGGVFTYLILINRAKYIFLILILVVGFLFLFSDVNIEGLNPFRTVSANNRLVNLSQSLEIASKNPIFGMGFNAYRDVQIRYNYRSYKGSLKSNADAGTDNSLIFVIATTGFIGFAFFVLSYLSLCIKLFKEKGSGLVILSMFVCLIISSMFVNALFYIPIMSWLLLVTGFRKQFF